MITIWQHTLLLYFTQNQFCTFKKFTGGLDVDESLFPFPDGEERLILRTPNTDINFSFSLEEWNDLNEAMDEAAHMENVNQLIRS